MSAKAPINRILRSSIVDGPGNRAVVFVQGCNYNCAYCHNPETISRFSDDKKDFSAEEVFAEIKPALAFIRGITVSGGECTLYPDFLLELGQIAHKHSLDFFLDSNGSYNFADNPALLNIVDSVMLDIKADPDDVPVYEKVIGRKKIRVKTQNLLDSAEYLAEQNKLYEVRTVISHGLFDAEALVEKVCSRLSKTSHRPLYKLIRYRPNGVRTEFLKTLKVPDKSYMNKVLAICEGYGIKAIVL
jgi:pyruvate formate lyase activating enzyme